MKDDTRRADVLGCPVDALDLEQTVERCLELIDNGRGAGQASLNALKVDLAHRDAGLVAALRRCEIVSADGVPIVWASRLLGRPLPGRVNGTDLMYELLAAADARGLSLYLLGTRPEVLDRAVARIRRDYPGLRIVGSHHGFYDRKDEPAVIDDIRATSPDLLFVAMPSPRKEELIDRHIAHLDVGLAMGVGGSLDVLAGELPRAPRWMQRSGLEWLFRLVHEPGRLWRRYLVANSRFGWLLVRELAGRPVRARGAARAGGS